MGRIHLATDHGYACGVGRRWPSQDITSTRSPDGVTCLTCQRLAPTGREEGPSDR